MQHFGETNNHNAATFSTLSATNAQMANSIQAQIADLTRKMEGLANAVQTTPPVQPNMTYQPAPVAQTPMYAQPPFAQMQQQQYTQAPPHQQTYGNRTFGRTGGRGRGNRQRRRNAYHQNNNPIQQQQWAGPNGHPNSQQPAQQQGFYTRQTHTNPVKYHKNWNYCWSCGYDVADDHTSASCPYPRQGHVYHATRTNTCNGCQKNKHKTPNVAGRGEVREIMNKNNNTCYTTHTSLPIPTYSMHNASATQNHNTDNYAIVDSGASDNYLTPTANVKSKTTLHQPIQVTQDNITFVTHMQNGPATTSSRTTRIHPTGMKNHSLISVTKICNAGCQVIFGQDECNIIHNGTIVMTGHKNKHNGLWYIPIKQAIHDTPYTIFPDTTTQHINSVYHTSTLAETIQFIHQCLFSPTIDTLCKALDNDQLIGFPPITSSQVRKYLPESTATAKGHLRRTRKHTRSSTRTRNSETLIQNQDFRPISEPNTDFNYLSEQQLQNKTMTGAFPVTSFHSNKYQFVAYEYRSNAILVRPLKDQTDKSLTNAFREVYEYLTDRGFQPKLNVMDNQCSKAVEKYIRSTKADIQLVNPDDHRVNAAERAIQTWKEHWLSGMGTLDPTCPIQLWCQFIEQGQDTLNLLRVSFNFDKTPLAPVGTRALILLDPNSRKTWQSHALDAWYVGPAKNHYRNYRFFIPTTKGYRISGSAKFFPKHTKMPAIEPGDTVRLAAQDLITAIKTLSTAPMTLSAQHTTALRQLADIFSTTAAVNTKEPSTIATPVTRVAAPAPPPRVSAPSTSVDPTEPTNLPTQRFVHQRHTRSNTPMPTPSEDTSTHTSQRQTKSTHDHNMPNYITQDDINAVTIKPPTGFIAQSTHTPCNIKAHALYHVVSNLLNTTSTTAYTPTKHSTDTQSFTFDAQLEHTCNGVVHPVTKETITKYEKLANDPLMQNVWTQAMCKELGRLAQGWDGSTGTDTIFFMSHNEIKNIPKDRTVTYARIVVDYRPQKDDPNRVRITVGGNLINYPGELTTRTADLTTAKILWNSTISTPDLLVQTSKTCIYKHQWHDHEYMRIKADLVPAAFKEAYTLWDKIHNGYIYMEIRRGCYGLPQAGILANKLLKQRLSTDGYFELPHTPGLFKHISRPVQFSLVVDDFGIKYTGQEHLDHLIQSIRKHYDVKVDHTGSLYCGITLDWHYEEKYLDISMPGYVTKQLTKYNHPHPKKPVNTPWEPYPIKYGHPIQETLPEDDSPLLTKQNIKHIQQIVGSFLYYARATDPTIPHALSELATQQSNATEQTLKRCHHFLDYMATHPDARIRYHASDMILNVHSDASYLSVKNAKSRAAGIFFLGWGTPTPTPIHCDNSTTVGIINNTVKRQKSRSMEMRYFWLLDGHINKYFDFQYHPGLENLADYPSKAHPGSHHLSVRPLYVHMSTSPRLLPRAATPSVRRGCADKVGLHRIRKYPLPTLARVPRGTGHIPAAAA
eukprot:CCRYP_011676-RA/>CCRYP_011676-RA protein AED:0.16 eAED:0.06 QI:0/0/0/1/0/0/6/0/1468